MKIYDTKKEREEYVYLVHRFDHIGHIIDPSKDVIWDGTMAPYLHTVRKCKKVVASEYQDHIGKGVFTEIIEAQKYDIPVFVIRKFVDEYFLLPVKEVVVTNYHDWVVEYGKIVVKE